MVVQAEADRLVERLMLNNDLLGVYCIICTENREFIIRAILTDSYHTIIVNILRSELRCSGITLKFETMGVDIFVYPDELFKYINLQKYVQLYITL